MVMYLDQECYDSDKEHQTARNLFVLSPSAKATPLSAKGLVTSCSRMTSVWEGPRSVLHRMKSTALMTILDPADYVRVLVGEQRTPLAFQVAAQPVWWSHVGNNECSDDAIVDDGQHD